MLHPATSSKALDIESVNVQMLRSGSALLSKSSKRFEAIVKQLEPHSEFARSRRLGCFEYGDYSLDDDEQM
jgi:hypothetical protein